MARGSWLVIGVLVAAACGGSGGGDGDPDAAVSTPDAGQSSPDAGQAACLADQPFDWPLPTAPVTITAHASWKNQIASRDDAFLSPWSADPDAVRWIKFAVLVKDPTKVYYQDSNAYEFHYEFATERLDPFLGQSRTDFDQLSLHAAGQEVILGAVLVPPTADRNEVGVQLVRQDAYHPEMVKAVLDLVAASVTGPSGLKVRYFPTFEQAETTAACAGWYAAQGVDVGSVDNWLTTDSCYASGWGMGRLTFVPGNQIAAAYTAGTLLPTDILLTDGVPADIPFVAGIITESASTPNSHVAILARSYGVPFAHMVDQAAVTRARGMVGKNVVLRAYAGFEGCQVDLLDGDGIPGDDRAAILALKAPPALSIQAIESYGGYFASTTGLSATDVRYFGGKAVGFGLLRAAIPNNSPDAQAISFDLWTDFMAQTMPSGNTLGADIASKLSGFAYPPNMAAVEQALADIQTMIKTQADFSAAQKQAILTGLNGFTATRKIRFRSSTNVEDTEHFVGAGLYSSYSGCVADDTDSDEVGPSACDATKVNERGVFRALRKVYASFYNTNAYLERLRHGVDESKVGMAVVVHYSFPDETELANGVATADRTQWSTNQSLVTQKGAVSVANPEGGATPEEVSVYANNMGGVYPSLVKESSLVPLGATVMDWPGDYEQLASLLVDVADAYASRNPALERFTLDFEYKKIQGDGLVVKQVRRLPVPDTGATWPAYLVNEPQRLCVFQGEYGDVMSNHRLKSVWNIATDNTWLNATTLQSGFYASIGLEYLDGTSQANLSGDPATWTDASHSYDGMRALDGWSVGTGPDKRDFTVEVSVPTEVMKSVSPLRVLADQSVYVSVKYATAVPTIDWQGVTTTDTEAVRLGPCPDDNTVTAVNRRVEETVSVGGVSVVTAYYWPEPPRGVVAGYTADLWQWDKTTITGLTTNPIELRGYYSQTYRPGHHNFSSDYVFDPWLEPGIDAAVLTELTTANVRLVMVRNSNELWVQGLDGVFRELR